MKLLATALLAVAAWSGPAAASAPPDSGISTESTATSPARAALADVLAWLAAPSTLDTDRFADEFLAAIPPEEIAAVFAELAGDWTVLSVDELAGDHLTAMLNGPDLSLEVGVVVDADGLITGLWFAPALLETPDSLDEVAARVGEMGSTSAFLAAEIDGDGNCSPITSRGEDVVLPIGSVFKLYVLGALAAAVDAGTIAWDEPVEIRDELDSLPSGITQDEPDGSALPVTELAERMIAISDNTATDHLIDLVGRDAVEAAVADLGHSDPALMIPFLTTRELFVLRGDAELTARYAAATTGGRRELLSGLSGPPVLDEDWTEPRDVMTVEWFASVADICRALVALDDLGATHPPVLAALSANRAMLDPDGRFDRVLHKGGSEPGVHVEAMLAATASGERYALIGGAASETEPIDPTLTAVLASALGLLDTDDD